MIMFVGNYTTWLGGESTAKQLLIIKMQCVLIRQGMSVSDISSMHPWTCILEY